MRHLALLTSALALTFAIPNAKAADLRVGLASEPTSADLHFHNTGPNNSMRRHIFESLIWQDENQQLSPLLATSWKPLDGTTWEFKLREGVTFHDGSAFDAYDVIYTICRIPTVEDAPSPFTAYTKAVREVEAPDPHTLIIKTGTPYPLLPVELSTWGVISAKANGVDGASIAFSPDGCGDLDYPKSQDFNDGTAAIGTGKYKLVSYKRGEGVELARNENYWGNAPHWENISFLPLTSDGPRVAALIAGDVDFIEKPPLQDLERINATDGLRSVQGISNRVIYLHFDHHNATGSPGVSGIEGDANPLRDVRVRQAISKAINREAIVARIMGGVAVPAGELLPAGMFGSQDMAVETYDPELAKSLLADAGYPDGFNLVLGSPNDRYINDAQIAQAIAQFLTRVGIKTDVDAITKSQFFSRRNNYEFSLYMAGWGSGTGEMSSPLKALLATRDSDKGFGGTNRGRYSNPEFDAVLENALATVDDAERERLLQEASAVAMADYAMLPLHFEVTPWAMKNSLTYMPRTDQYTIAFEILPAE